MMSHRPHAVTLAQFSAAFIPFGVLLVAALMWPETTDAVDLNRTIASIWATTVLLGIALSVYPFGSISESTNNLASLYWTFAWILFLAHAYWAIFVIYDGVADTWNQMGPRIAGTNFFLTIWWSVDVLLVWTITRDPQWLTWAHIAARVFAFLVFAATLLFLRAGAARYLGVVFVVTALAALAIRAFADDKRAKA
jgi:hypothetical protein